MGSDLRFDAYRFATRQLKGDRERTRSWPRLFGLKAKRMAASPFAFLRGSAHFFYDVLSESRTLRRGPHGRGWIVGDAHIENFGAFRPGTPDRDEHSDGSEARVTFGLNDFDEAVVAPFRFDVLRLTTSLILLARDRGVDAPTTLAGCSALVSTYCKSLFAARVRVEDPPPAIALLLDKVAKRKRIDLLNDRTEVIDGSRRFVRNDRHLSVSKRTERAVCEAFPRYLTRLPEEDRPSAEQSRILDVAYRVAGIGSLGKLRLAILVAGKSGQDGAWMFEMKEASLPAASCVVGDPEVSPAKRVVLGARACLSRTPHLLGTVKVDGLPMVVRRLAPQEDKLDPATITSDNVQSIASYCGALLGIAHRRGSRDAPTHAWTTADQDSVLQSAIRLAALHEEVWLAYFHLLR